MKKMIKDFLGILMLVLVVLSTAFVIIGLLFFPVIALCITGLWKWLWWYTITIPVLVAFSVQIQNNQLKKKNTNGNPNDKRPARTSGSDSIQ